MLSTNHNLSRQNTSNTDNIVLSGTHYRHADNQLTDALHSTRSAYYPPKSSTNTPRPNIITQQHPPAAGPRQLSSSSKPRNTASSVIRPRRIHIVIISPGCALAKITPRARAHTLYLAAQTLGSRRGAYYCRAAKERGLQQQCRSYGTRAEIARPRNIDRGDKKKKILYTPTGAHSHARDRRLGEGVCACKLHTN